MAKTAETFYTYGAGLTSETKAEGTYYYHFNNIGSTTEITDAAGAVKYRITYGPYGELTGITDGNQNQINIADEYITPFLYNGQMGVQTDQNGLYYMRARYYNTDIKRFINRDTISGDLTNSQSLNRYSYVQGNPVSLTDPFGLSPMGGDIMSILPQLIHTGLAIGGFFWDGFDLINAVYYAAEGNTLMAMSCGVAAIPFLGSVASKGVSKIAFKVLKSADKASDLVKAAKLSKAAGYINDISKLVGYTGMATLGAIDTAYAYQDYKAAKANGEDATLELCSVILNGAFTAVSGIRAVSSAAKVTARLKADGVGDAVKAAVKNAMSNNKGCASMELFVGKGNGKGTNFHVTSSSTGASAGKGNGRGADFYVTPGGTAIPKDYYHSLSNVDTRKWYLAQEAKIPDLIDYNQPLEKQAYQAFSLRNEFRTTARELMADRKIAESLYVTDPNKTWEEMIKKQIDKGLKGDDIYTSIISSAQRSRPAVNKSLGLE